MNFFIWMFLILAAYALLIYIVYFSTGFFFGYRGAYLYGMETDDANSPLGIFIRILLLFKVFIAFSMWTEKKWAIDMAILDAVLGIIICVYMMFVEPLAHVSRGHFEFNLRLEILCLIPYLIKCLKINTIWKNMKVYIPGPVNRIRKKVIFSHEKNIKTVETVQIETADPQYTDPYIAKENIDREDDEDYLKRYMPK